MRSSRWVRACGATGLVLLLAACSSGGDTTPEGTSDTSAPQTDAAPTEGASGEDGGSALDGLDPITLDLASFYNPSTSTGAATEWWIEELEARTDGLVTVEPFWDSSLLGPTEIKDGVVDGRVDLGHFSYAYHPAEFPLSTVVEVPFLGNNLPAQSTALNELYAGNEDFRTEYEDKGIRVMSFAGSPSPLTGANEPFDSIDFLEGKTVRASGFMVQGLQAIGADPVGLGVNEVYEAMQRGTIDAYSGLILDVITPLGLHEVGPHVVDAGTGHYASVTLSMSLDTWEGLPAPVQEIIEELNAEFPEQHTAAAEETEDAACTEILESGGSVTIFPPEETERWAEALGDAPLEGYLEGAAEAGADGQEIHDTYEAAFDRAAAEDFPDYASGMERCVAQQENAS